MGLSTISVDAATSHLRNHVYMSGVNRDTCRTKKTAEVFTPTALVQEILDTLDPELFRDPSKNFIDNSCGDGQFLAEVLVRKLENGIDFETALSGIYGVELMPDNAKLCQNRLLCNQEQFRHIVEKNIINADALRYHYRFDSSPPYDTVIDKKILADAKKAQEKAERDAKKAQEKADKKPNTQITLHNLFEYL